MWCESDIKLLIMYILCIFCAINFDPPGITHDSLPLVSRARPAGGCPGISIASFRRRPHSRSVAAFAALVLAVPCLDERLPGLTLPDGCSALAPLRRPAGQPVGLENSGTPILPRRAPIMITASPLGEEEAVPKEAERGGYLPIPQREARAGEWLIIKIEFQRCSNNKLTEKTKESSHHTSASIEQT